ncbi:branched-chain-amino-acid aminotransferase [Tropilaelaps mercedesae]|uniref:Branched-chain-amino-acid aminotransferase n=1 Tax=Tropilaelaps mercedesae TaxID=418985 RepID=A0A1V9WYA9_9ACAR|nr:branched-chain-amino-acid aminotransferase [Tropilaelaps mercedesae]
MRLLANPEHVRAQPGGSDDRKLDCNYAPTLAIQRDAENLGLYESSVRSSIEVDS